MKQNEEECLKLVSDSTELYENIIESKMAQLKELHSNNTINDEDFNSWQSTFQDVLSKIEALNQQIANYKDDQNETVNNIQ